MRTLGTDWAIRGKMQRDSKTKAVCLRTWRATRTVSFQHQFFIGMSSGFTFGDNALAFTFSLFLRIWLTATSQSIGPLRH